MTFLNNFLGLCYGYIPTYQNIQGLSKKGCNESLMDEVLHIQKYINVYCNRFEIKNLPEETSNISGKNKIFMLMMFFASGVAVFEDTTLGVQILPVTGGFKYDIAGNPTEWEVFGLNGYRKKLNEKNSVLIINDYAYSIPFLQVLYNLKFMLECDQTHKQNLIAQRQPLIMEMEEDEKKSASTFINKLLGFDSVIKVRVRAKEDAKRGSSTYNTQAFSSGKSFEGEKLGADYRYFENRIFTYLGYNNENIEKKERLLKDEVNANNSVINSNYTTAFNCLKDGFDRANKMFGTNIQVVPTEMVEIQNKEEKEEATNDFTNYALSEREVTEKLVK